MSMERRDGAVEFSRDPREAGILSQSGVVKPGSSLKNFMSMKILSAIGLAIGIIVLKVLVGELFAAFEDMLITLFTTIDIILKEVR